MLDLIKQTQMNTNKATFSKIVIDNVKMLESTINQTKINSDKLKQTIESEKRETIAILQGIKEDNEGNLDKLLNDRYLISKNSNSKQL